MSTVINLPQIPNLSEGDTEMFAVDCSDLLDGTELLTGTPTAVEQTTSDLTIGNVAVNTATLTILGRSVVAGKAVQFSVSGQLQANSPYTVRVTTATDASPARTFVRDAGFTVGE